MGSRLKDIATFSARRFRGDLWLVVAFSAVLGSCGVPEPTEPPPEVRTVATTATPGSRGPFDPDVITFGFDALDYRFDGEGSNLTLDEGWSPATRDEAPFAWVTDTHAIVFFGHRGEGPLAFRALARSFWFEGAPQQTMTVTLNGSPAGEASLRGGWKELSVELPSRHLVAGLNRIDLDFSFARRPKDLGMNNDERQLSAAFRWIAIDRKPEPGRDLGRRRAWIDDPGTSLVLDKGAEVGLPLAPGTKIHWSGLQPGVEVALEGEDGDWTTVWPGGEGATSDTSFTASNPGKVVRFLRISRRPDGADSDAASADQSPAPIEVSLESLEISHDSATDRGSPNVFIYVVDALRKDSLEVYGSKRPTSPRLRAFAEDGVVFENAVAASTWTLPSTVSLITGVYPFQHKVMQGDIKVTSGGGYPLLPEVLGGAGYATLGISQSFVAGPRFGVNSGFEHYFLNNHLNGRILRTGDMRRTLTDWLSFTYDWSRPIFTYMHTVGPHAPYIPTPEFMRFADENPGSLPLREYRPSPFVTEGHGDDPKEVAHLRALYDGEVAYADAQFGRFLDLLRLFGMYDDSLVVFTSDHGEEFKDHGAFDHGRTVYNEVAEVPMIVKFPKSSEMPRGKRVTTRVSSLDVFPTVLETAGVAAVGGWGKSLVETVRAEESGGEPKASRPVFTQVNPVRSEIFESVDYVAAWVDDVKCIHSRTGRDLFGKKIPEWQYFDLAADHRETQPLTEDDDPRTTACREILEGWMAHGAEYADGADAPAAAEETLDMLRAIGYIE